MKFLQARRQPRIVFRDDLVAAAIDHQAGTVGAAQAISIVPLAAARAEREPRREPHGVKLRPDRVRRAA